MELESEFINGSKELVKIVYREADPLLGLEGKILQGVHAYCFCNGQLVVVHAEKKGYWSPPGGGIEPGESYEEAIVREVMEETNMRVLHQKLIGYQDIFEPTRIVRQTRSFCIVEPIGEFVSDPDGDITEIRIINPQDYKQYFDWGIIGDRIMSQALEKNEKFKNNF